MSLRAAILLFACMIGLRPLSLAQLETRASFGFAKSVPYSAAIGDFDRDGSLDAAVVNYLPSGAVDILLGNGDGTFRAGATYAVGIQPHRAVAASLRHNGVLDLVVSDASSANVYVMLGNGDGTFQPPVAYPTVGEAFSVGTGDFNNDGKLDIIALTGVGCNCVEVLPGNGDGTFGAAAITPVSDIGGTAMATGYFDSDTTLDVAVTGFFFGANQVDILLGNGDGTFRPNGFYNVSLNPESVAAADLNGDQKEDLVVGDDGGVEVLLGNGDGTFQQPVIYPTNFLTDVIVKDLDGDGRPDLLVSNPGITSANPPGVSVLKGNGDGTFQPRVFYPAGREPSSLVAGDFNGDGKPDVLIVDNAGDYAITLLNTGAAVFSPTSPLTFRSQLIGTTSAPLNLTLTNSGKTGMTISSVTNSGWPFRVTKTTCQGTLPPGNHCTMAITFVATVKGPTLGTVTFNDSASSKPQVVELLGIGTVVVFSPTELSFPPRKIGSTTVKTMQIINTGSVPLNFPYRVGRYGPDRKDFVPNDDCHPQIGPGASCTVTVTFTPHQVGPRSAFLQITTDGGAGQQNVPLTGTGID